MKISLMLVLVVFLLLLSRPVTIQAQVEVDRILNLGTDTDIELKLEILNIYKGEFITPFDDYHYDGLRVNGSNEGDVLSFRMSSVDERESSNTDIIGFFGSADGWNTSIGKITNHFAGWVPAPLEFNSYRQIFYSPRIGVYADWGYAFVQATNDYTNMSNYQYLENATFIRLETNDKADPLLFTATYEVDRSYVWNHRSDSFLKDGVLPVKTHTEFISEAFFKNTGEVAYFYQRAYLEFNSNLNFKVDIDPDYINRISSNVTDFEILYVNPRCLELESPCRDSINAIDGFSFSDGAVNDDSNDGFISYNLDGFLFSFIAAIVYNLHKHRQSN